jgi:hypothetical protein
LRWGGRGG